ncbi:hypothetical protein [Enterococcus olivae]
MAIQFYLDVEGKRHILPVNPEEIFISTDSKNTVTEVVKLGDINQFGDKALATTSFASYFPASMKDSLANPKATKKTPQQWVTTIQDAMNTKKRVRLIVTDCGINVLMAVESFEWGYTGMAGDVRYTISLKEYRDHAAKFVKTVAKKVSLTPARPTPTSKPITVGCEVICNGRLHRDSYGTGPGQTEKNARRKVNIIAKGRKCPYHVTNLQGGWRGWVTAESVKRV